MSFDWLNAMTALSFCSMIQLVCVLMGAEMEAALLRDPDVDYELTDLTQQVNKVVLAVNANKERFTKVDRATNQSVQILKEDLAELEFDNLVELGVMGLVNFLFCLFVIYNYYTKTCGSHNIASAITKIEANTQGLMNAGLKNVHFGQDQLKTAVADLTAALQREKTQSQKLVAMVESSTEQMKAALMKQDELNDKIAFMQEQQQKLQDNQENISN